MINLDSSTYYDLLEISPEASPQEVRDAYIRAKAAFKKNSVALYSLMSESETEDLLRKMEVAYQVLSNSEKRKAYDRSHGLIGATDPIAKVISIDRVPPMERLSADSDLLVAPKTDFVASSSSGGRSAAHAMAAPVPEEDQLIVDRTSPVAEMQPVRISASGALDDALIQEITLETEWRGPFFRKIREARKVSIEELSTSTKISKTYLKALEEETFAKLPAAVYLRGFVTQVCKFLKLPHEKAVAPYMARYTVWVEEREKNS